METLQWGWGIGGRLRANEISQQARTLNLTRIRSIAIPTLNVEEVLHMEGGVGDASYANNSLVQKTIIKKAQPVLEEALSELAITMSPECLMVADLGCSSGPNVLEVISTILNVTSAKRDRPKEDCEQEVQVFLNDLLGNDFNSLFKIVVPGLLNTNNNNELIDTDDQLNYSNNNSNSNKNGEIVCYVSGTPGSFYGRLFPKNFLHFAHASSSLHFLSRVPKGLVNKHGQALNKGAIYITASSPPEVYKAYSDQFKRDFTSFLSLRSQEIISGGRMVLTFRCIPKSDNLDYVWDLELVGIALKSMVHEGLLEARKLDAYNVPYYTPAVDQVKDLIEAEGSFTLCKVQTFTVDWCLKEDESTLELDTQAKLAADRYRAAMGPLFAHEFGARLVDGLFQRFQNIASECLATRKLEVLNIVVSLIRNNY